MQIFLKILCGPNKTFLLVGFCLLAACARIPDFPKEKTEAIMCVFMRVHVWVPMEAIKRALDLLELELQVRLCATSNGSFGRAVSTVN